MEAQKRSKRSAFPNAWTFLCSILLNIGVIPQRIFQTAADHLD